VFCFLVSAPFAAASFLLEALDGSERPSVNQLGSGRLKSDDFSDALSSAASLEDDLALWAGGLVLDVADFGGMCCLLSDVDLGDDEMTCRALGYLGSVFTSLERSLRGSQRRPEWSTEYGSVQEDMTVSTTCEDTHADMSRNECIDR
jgi:hypothetical protein